MAQLHARGELPLGDGLHQRVGDRQPLRRTARRGDAASATCRRWSPRSRARLDHRRWVSTCSTRRDPFPTGFDAVTPSGDRRRRRRRRAVAWRSPWQRRGVAVTTLERRPARPRGRRPGTPAGSRRRWRSPSRDLGVIAQSLRWLVNPSGPLWIRPTRLAALLDWISRFMASCSRRAPTAAGWPPCRRPPERRPRSTDSPSATSSSSITRKTLLYPAFAAASSSICSRSRPTSARRAPRADCGQVSAGRDAGARAGAQRPGWSAALIAEGRAARAPRVVRRRTEPGRRGASAPT